MLSPSNLHLSVVHELLHLDIEYVTVSENLIRKLFSALYVEWIFDVGVQATHDKNAPAVLHRREELKPVGYLEPDTVSWKHHLGSLNLNVYVFTVLESSRFAFFGLFIFLLFLLFVR